MMHSVTSVLRFHLSWQPVKRFASVTVDSIGNPLSVMRLLSSLSTLKLA